MITNVFVVISVVLVHSFQINLYPSEKITNSTESNENVLTEFMYASSLENFNVGNNGDQIGIGVMSEIRNDKITFFIFVNRIPPNGLVINLLTKCKANNSGISMVKNSTYEIKGVLEDMPWPRAPSPLSALWTFGAFRGEPFLREVHSHNIINAPACKEKITGKVRIFEKTEDSIELTMNHH